MFKPPHREGMRGHCSDLVIAWAVEKYGARRLVDLGCGNGRDALQLIRCGLADFVLGIDDGSEPHNGKIATVKDMIPSDVAGKLELWEGDYATLTMNVDECDLCYSNNVIEHVADPEMFVRFSLWMAPLAMFVLPHVRHGWCEDHLHWWTAGEFRRLLEKHGEVLELDVMADPPPFPCHEEHCKHELLFAVIRRADG
uniref:Putative methyltransferase n=1 Tax=viral metagenome TaxID=1070528 RepID=A0A6M3KMD6_9ZZZZ